MELTWELALAFFVLATVAGTLDTMAGGGGLITVPGQIFLGVPPVVSIVNNKCSAFAGTCMASWRLYQKGLLVWRDVRASVALAFIGSLFGALALKGLDPAWVSAGIPWVLMGIALYFAVSSRLNLPRAQLPSVVSVLAIGLVGAYDGFFGPGTGSLMLAALMLTTQYSITRCTVQVKACNAASNCAALLIFAPSALVIWPVALVMLAGQTLGGFIGARWVELHAERVARPLVVVVSLIMAGRLLYGQISP